MKHLESIKNLVECDAYACTFQTMGHYRAAVIGMISDCLAAAGACRVRVRDGNCTEIARHLGFALGRAFERVWHAEEQADFEQAIEHLRDYLDNPPHECRDIQAISHVCDRMRVYAADAVGGIKTAALCRIINAWTNPTNTAYMIEKDVIPYISSLRTAAGRE